jgi:hypothetical protein
VEQAKLCRSHRDQGGRDRVANGLCSCVAPVEEDQSKSGQKRKKKKKKKSVKQYRKIDNQQTNKRSKVPFPLFGRSVTAKGSTSDHNGKTCFRSCSVTINCKSNEKKKKKKKQ